MFDRAPARRWSDALVRPSRQTLVTVAVVVLTLALNLVQQPGLVTFDTKLDLQFDPGGFLSRSLSLWNGDSVVGGLQNQASGYLFPMGPAFWLGHVLGVPMWIWERLWSAAVMLLAYAGVRRLAAHWPGIGWVGAVLAGLTYMLAPRVLTTVGGLSGETLPAAVLPWTVLPVVLYLQGRLRARTAFLLSAATVPWMGGQNATLVVACLVLPALLLALAAGRSLARRAKDVAGWGALVGVASLWWVVPLLLLGSYAPPFLDFIESAKDTAGDIGWLSSLRGTSHWVAFFPGGGRLGWTGGYELASSPWVLVTSVLVAAVGLAGLLRGELWQRRVLVWSVLVGLAILTAGSGSWAGSVFSGAWLDALDSFLAPLRNIHKFDPVVRLPLALGVGALATHGLPRLRRSVAPRRARAVGLAVVAALVLAAAGPAAAGSLRTDDGFTDVPDSWRDAVAYIDAEDQPTRTLVLPGPTFAVQTWGRTVDEPIQVLHPSPWLSRAQLSIAPAGTVRLLESLEESMSDARPQERVVEALRSLGITHVILRHDLDPAETDAPDPGPVRDTITHVPGARRVATSGERPGGGPLIEVYELDQSGDPRVQVQDWDRRAVVSGGPEVVPDLRAAGLVGDEQAAVLATKGVQPDVVTDSLRRVERTFGRANDARSGVMTAQDGYRVDRPAHDYDDAMPEDRTVAAYDGAASIVASSSGGYADVFGVVRPEQQPYSAFDRSIYTAWESAPLTRPEGQWVEVTFRRPTEVGAVSLTFDNIGGTAVKKVRVSTGHRSVEADVRADGTAPDLQVDDDAARRLRVTVLEAESETGRVRLPDVRIAGHDITRSLVLPGTVAADTAVFASSEAPRRACSVSGDSGTVTCGPTRQLETSETPGFDRDITVSEAGTWRVTGRAVATNGPALDRLFEPLGDDPVRVVASSTYGGDPAVTAAGAMDGRPRTGWTSAPGDQAAALQLNWGPRRLVTRVQPTLSSATPGELPLKLLVDAGPGTGEPQVVTTTGPQAGKIRPVRTRQLRVTALGTAGAAGFGISELHVSGIADLRHQPALRGPTGSACGFGPTIEVAGQVVQTRLTGTLRQVRNGAELAVVPCGSRSVSMAAGPDRIHVTNPAGFAMTSVSLVPPTTPVAASVSQPQVLSWSDTERRVEVAADRDSVLAVGESYNRGWTASVSGRELTSVTLDGWRQGFVLPAGTTGVVKLEYAPQTGFRVALVGGLLLAGVMVGLAVLVLTRSRRRARGGEEPGPVPPEADPGRPLGRVAQLVTVLVLAVVSLPLAAGFVLGRLARRRDVRHVAAACTGILAVAAVVALWGSAVVPPAGSDVMAALAVGLVCGHVLTRPAAFVTGAPSGRSTSESVG